MTYKEIIELTPNQIAEILEKYQKALDDVYHTGYSGISYVGAANYHNREISAKNKLACVYEEHLKKIEKI